MRRLLAPLLLALVVSSPGLGATINVPADHTTIQAAVDAATNGDTILVAAGTYSGSVDFTGKSLSLIGTAGAGLTRIQSTASTAIKATNVTGLTIRGFTIVGINATPSPDVGGIDAAGSTGTIEKNSIGPTWACGTQALRTDGAIVVRNNVIWGAFLGDGCGMVVGQSAIVATGGAQISDNLIANNGVYYGGVLLVTGEATVERNAVVANGNSIGRGAIRVEGGTPDREILIQNNLIANNAFQGEGPSGTGVATSNADGLVLRYNTFSGQFENLSITADNPTLRAPRIEYNVFDSAIDGIACTTSGGATPGTFTANAFLRLPWFMPAPTCFASAPASNFTADEFAFQSVQYQDLHILPWARPANRGARATSPATDFDGDARVPASTPAWNLPDVGFDESSVGATRPETELVSGPDQFMNPDSPVSFVFRSSTTGATFECNVDMAGWRACTSPLKLPGTEERTHSFMVRARTSAGRDPSPATRFVRFQRGWKSPCTMTGTNSADTLRGPALRSNNWICGRGGSDRLIVTGQGVPTADGGAGNDVLIYGAIYARFIGGDGLWDIVDYSGLRLNNTVHLGGRHTPYTLVWSGDDIDSSVEGVWSGSGNDTLVGYENDNIFDGGLGADIIRGGGGFDYVDYRPATTPVRVDLTGSTRNDGFPGEHDSVARDVEGVLGGRAGDVLMGGNAANELDGYGGDDLLNPARASDSVFAGGGNDLAVVNDASNDYVNCGAGRDLVVMNQGDVTVGCEVRVMAPNPWQTAPLHWATVAGPGGNATVGVRASVVCATNRAGACAIKTVAIAKPTIGGKVVSVRAGSVTVQVPRGQGAAKIKIPLSSAARALFTTRSSVPVTLKVYLLTGTKYVSMGALKYRLYKNGTASLELQSVEPVRDMPPMSPVPRSARGGSGG